MNDVHDQEKLVKHDGLCSKLSQPSLILLVRKHTTAPQALATTQGMVEKATRKYFQGNQRFWCVLLDL